MTILKLVASHKFTRPSYWFCLYFPAVGTGWLENADWPYSRRTISFHPAAFTLFLLGNYFHKKLLSYFPVEERVDWGRGRRGERERERERLRWRISVPSHQMNCLRRNWLFYFVTWEIHFFSETLVHATSDQQDDMENIIHLVEAWVWEEQTSVSLCATNNFQTTWLWQANNSASS